jgi:hypothetical protein
VRRLARRAHREFVHVRLAEQHGPGARQAIDDVGVERRRVVGEHARAAGRPHAGGGEDVLVRDRDADQWPVVAFADRPVGGARVGQRPVGVDGDERIELPVECSIRERCASASSTLENRFALSDADSSAMDASIIL